MQEGSAATSRLPETRNCALEHPPYRHTTLYVTANYRNITQQFARNLLLDHVDFFAVILLKVLKYNEIASFKQTARLRVLARYEAQNRPLFYISFDIFINMFSFKNLNVNFLTKGP